MNLFRPNRPAADRHFVARRRPLKRAIQALESPKKPLLLVGRPRSGKTSVIVEAVRRLRSKAPLVLHVDTTTCSTLSDVAGRLLRQASSPSADVRLANKPDRWVRAVGSSATVARDPDTGRSIATIGTEARALPADAQREIMSRVFDVLSEVSSDSAQPIAVVLEGVERLEGIGGADAVWQLRAALGRQTSLRRILTTDSPDFADVSTRADGALAGWGRTVSLRAIKPNRMAAWVKKTVQSDGGSVTAGALREITEEHGPRAGDIVRLAAASYARAGSGGKVRRKTVYAAAEDLAVGRSGEFRDSWRALTPRQQNLLRALAGGELRPFAADVRKRYDLRSSAAVARSLELLIQKGLVYRSETNYAIDNPFFRRWVEREALADVGI